MSAVRCTQKFQRRLPDTPVAEPTDTTTVVGAWS